MEIESTGQVPPSKKFGMGQYIKSKREDDYRATAEFRKATQTIKEIRKLSAIYGFVIHELETKDGTAFVYCELHNGSGAVALAMCLESIGYERFNESRNVFGTGKAGGVAKQSVCAGREEVGDEVVEEEAEAEEEGPKRKRARKATIQPRKRYGLISGETDLAKQDALLAAFNSFENRHGDYIRVLIGSKTTRDGRNMANVTRVFLMPLWTPSGLYQAMSRAIRATSHVDLVAESEAHRVRVKVYRMAAVNSKRDTVDYDMYRIVEKKDKEIALERRKLKRVAVDCHLQRTRNIRAGEEEDGTPECDYQECDYERVDPKPPTGTDLTTYRMFVLDGRPDGLLALPAPHVLPGFAVPRDQAAGRVRRDD